jgi:hypothetical protein
MGYAMFDFPNVGCLLLVFFDTWYKPYEEVEWGLSSGHTGP